MVTGTVTVETASINSLLSSGMVSASDVDADIGASIILSGGGDVGGLVHCRFWLHPV